MTRPGAQPLGQYTGYLLRRAFVRSARCVRGCLPVDGSIREWAALLVIDERGPLSQQALGALTHVNRSLVVKLVDDLEERGWVVRERSEQDRRSYALRLTDVGLAARAGVRGDLDRGERAFTAPVTGEEVLRLRSRLTSLLEDDPAVGLTALAGRSGYLVAQAHRRLREHAAARLGPLGLHPRHFGLLMTLGSEQPCSQSRLAASLGISAPGLLPDLDDLQAAALVSRVRNPTDRRIRDLTLTDQGRRLLREAQQVAATVQDEVRTRLGPTGDADLRRLLAKLAG